MNNTTMTMEQFTEELTKCLKRKLKGAKLTLRKVTKNNGVSKTGCSVVRDGARIAPVFYMEDYYTDYLGGAGIEDIADILVQSESNAMDRDIPDMDFFDNYEIVRKNLSVQLLGTAKNEEKLKEIPNYLVADMAVACFWIADDSFFERGTVEINYEMLSVWGISKEKLFQDALRNAVRILPASIMNIGDLIGYMKGENSRAEMYVISNSQNVFGAAAVLYPEVLRNYAIERKCNFYVLPSSIHEMILIPDDNCTDYRFLSRIVKEVNRTEIRPEEILTDSVYYYDRFKDTLQIAFKSF